MRRFGIVLMTLALGAAGAGSSQLPPVAKSSPIPATGAPGGGMVGVLASGALETANPSALETPKADTSLGIPTAAANAKRVPGSFIVALAPGQDPSKVSAEIAREYGGEAKFVYDHVIHGFAFSGPDDARQRLANDPRVSDVQPDFEAHVAEPSASVHLQVDDAPGGSWYPYASPLNRGSGVRIGILDTGVVQPSHPAIAGLIDPDSTATCVNESSITGGSPHGMRTVSNAVGTIGTAPLAHAVVVKVFPGTSENTSYSTIACGINYIVGLNQSTDATKHVQVVNASIAGPTEVDSNKVPTDCTKGMHKAVCQLVYGSVGNAPASFFAAAGNAGCLTCSGGDTSGISPANFPESIAVSGFNCPTVGSCTTSTPNFAVWSFHGKKIAVGAPGQSIQAATPGGSYGTFTGTSRAAPQLAGAAADVLSASSTLTPDQVRIALERGGRCPNPTDQTKKQTTVNGREDWVCNSGSWPADTKDGVAEPLLDVAGAIAAAAAPSGSFKAPNDRATVKGASVLFQVDANDDNFHPGPNPSNLTVSLKIGPNDVGLIGFNSVTGKYEYTWDSRAVVFATYQVQATIKDHDSPTERSTTIFESITVDNRPHPTEHSLTYGNSGTAGTNVTTATITPTATSLELAAVIARSTIGNTTPTLTDSGCNLTWVALPPVAVSASNPFKQLTLFRAQGTPSSPSCTLKFDFGSTTVTNFAWSVTEYGSVVDDSPHNGLGAVRQPTSAVGSGTAASVGLPSPFLARSATFGVAANSNGAAPQIPGPGSGFTKLDEQVSGGGICTFWRFDSSNTVGSSWTGASTHWGIIGLEIVAA